MTDSPKTTKRPNILDWVITYGIPAAVMATYNAMAGDSDISVKLAVAAIVLGASLAVFNWWSTGFFKRIGLGDEVLLQVVFRASASAGLAVAVAESLM